MVMYLQGRKRMDRTMERIVAVIGLVILESIAMFTGHDGAFFLPVVGVIGGIVGYGFGKNRQSKLIEKEVPEKLLRLIPKHLRG